MWIVERVEVVEGEANDGNDEYPVPRAFTTLVVDGEPLVEVIEFVDFARDPTPLRMCAVCGGPGCNDSDHVSIRHFGAALVILPGFAAMRIDPSTREPPRAFQRRGCPCFAGAVLDDLLARVPALAPIDRWPPLSFAEAAAIVQWEAPGRFLGEIGARPSLPDSVVVVIEDDDPGACRDALMRLLDAGRDARGAAVRAQGEAVTFHLDLPSYPAWQPLARRDDGFVLVLAPGLAVAPA